ncbi:toast rack family protein [Pontibacillus sp. HMF3514]|uniref:toast rack family protein n=1 Tax=Pontibacillus sp. HMF3514 TaxID=2692425 RepID=UPI00132011C2|nr:toast rack family protein [Pontibacillus sp. HMF3514]QHE50642.1 hypothetical protein GS400_00435 [Pontibacillus sp. HMF3514]
MKRKFYLWCLSVGLLVVLSGCNLVFSEEVMEEEIKIEAGQAEELKVDLDMGAGKLIVQGGAEDWLNGKFRYSDKKLDPDVSYNQDQGQIRIDQSNVNFNYGKDTKNEWDLQLTNDTPIELNVNTGASKTELNLEGINLNHLNIDSGVGKLTVDLSGDWEESFDVNVESGVGKTTFILPSDQGVKIKSDSGIGTTSFEGFISKGDGIYVNEAYEKSDVTIEINADVGVGKTVFKKE